LFAAVTQQSHLGNVSIGNKYGDETENAARTWVVNNSYLIASEPGWGAAWDYALNVHSGDTDPYDPGADPGVITDGMILSAVQALIPVPEPEPESPPVDEPAP
jgi:hypothetical protein